VEQPRSRGEESDVSTRLRRERLPRGGWPVAFAILVVGMSWVGLKAWESYQAGRLMTLGPTELSATHVWDEGKISVRWRWRRTGVAVTVKQGPPLTLCIASGVLSNADPSRDLRVSSASLVLMDAAGSELHEMSQTLGWGTPSGYMPQQNSALKPGESRELTIKANIPTGLLRDVVSLDGRLAFEFVETKPRK
jgi:hypothetical protein